MPSYKVDTILTMLSCDFDNILTMHSYKVDTILIMLSYKVDTFLTMPYCKVDTFLTMPSYKVDTVLKKVSWPTIRICWVSSSHVAIYDVYRRSLFGVKIIAHVTFTTHEGVGGVLFHAYNVPISIL